MPKIKNFFSRRRRRRSKLGSSMGNKITRTQVSASEYYLYDLPSSYNLVVIEVLVCGRFFMSILCKHDEGLVLVKVYFKRGDPLVLKEYERRLEKIREIFHMIYHPHVWPFQMSHSAVPMGKD